MSRSEEQKVEAVLAALRAGEISYRQATDELFALIYGELHRQASRLMKSERTGHTLQTTALVHEAYLNLTRGKPQAWDSRGHFFGVASRAMRQVLVDQARRRVARKRGGAWTRVTLDDNLGLQEGRALEVLELDDALTRFAGKHARMALTAELRIFSGLELRDIANLLGVSIRTSQGDWRVAKMWLTRELAGHTAP